MAIGEDGTQHLLQKSSAAASPASTHRKLGTLALAGMIFFTATGGAYGSEATIRAAGPLYALVAFIIFPWIWSLPQAMYTAELSTVLPVDGGICVWAKVAFAEYWGFQGGIWSWMEGASTLAAYPTLVVDYLQQILDSPLSPVSAWLLKAGLAGVLVLLNMRGISWVGISAASLGVLVLLPLLVMVCLGISQVDVSLWLQHRSFVEADWTYFFNLMLWNNSGYDNMGSISGEVRSPRSTIPRAQVIALIAGTISYIVPLAVATGVDPAWEQYHEGHLAKVAGMIGGEYLLLSVLLGAAAARLSNFMAELCTNSYFLQGMSAQALLPAFLSYRHPVYDTPWASILFNFCVVLVLMMLRLPEILQIANIFTIASFFLGVSCLVKIRKTRPLITRDQGAFSVPLDTPSIMLCVLPALALAAGVLWSCTLKIFMLTGLLFLFYQLLYLLVLVTRARKIIPYVIPPPIQEVWYTF